MKKRQLTEKGNIMTLGISGLYIALTGLLAFALMFKVIGIRKALGIGIGDGGNHTLSVAMRAHGNLLENAPIVLLLFIVAEVGGLPAYLLHIFGVVWIVARILHAVGMIKGNGGTHAGRFMGVVFTWLVLLGLIGVNISFFLGSA